MAVLKIDDLKKHFGKIQAVNGISLETKEGELLALLGASGSGKTTLMRMVAGLEQPTSGDILIDNSSVIGIPPRHRNVAMVFQSYALYPNMTVMDNITFPLRSRRIPRETWKKRIDWAVSILSISQLLERKPTKLSGGEKQRVALARAMVREPELFIFDEPLSALDAQVRNVARAELRDLQKRTGITTLYVTHDQLEALGLGDRVVVMRSGVIRQIGTPAELYDKPADLFVAGFIGNPPMNLVDRGDKVLGVRAEHLLLKAEGAIPDDCVTLTLRAEQREYLGSEWLVYGFEAHEGGGRVVVRLPQDQGDAVKTGGLSTFYAERRHVKYFDKATEKLID